MNDEALLIARTVFNETHRTETFYQNNRERFARFVSLAREPLEKRIAELEAENNTLRGLLGNSAKDCPYCGLPADKQNECLHGFPGCSRADDQMLSKHFADAYRAERAEAELKGADNALEAVNAQCEAAEARVKELESELART